MPTILTLFKNVLRKLDPAEVDQNFENLRTNLDKLGGYAASQTPGANQIPVLSANGRLGVGTSSAQNVLDLGSATSGRGIAWGGTAGATNYTNIWSSYASGSLVFAMGLRGGVSADTFESSTGVAAAKSAIRIEGTGGISLFSDAVTTTPTGTQVTPTKRLFLTPNGRLLVGSSLTENTSGASLQTKDGLTFSATQVPSSDPNTLDDYREASYTATATGLTTVPTATVSFVRVGNQVTMTIPYITGVSNATTFTLTGMPTTARPSGARSFLTRVIDNGGTTVAALGIVQTTGEITLYANVAAGAFTASGNKTHQGITIAYNI